MVRYYFEVKEEIKDCLKCPLLKTDKSCPLQKDADELLRWVNWKVRKEGCPLKEERVWKE